jgi:hypothetical protein
VQRPKAVEECTMQTLVNQYRSLPRVLIGNSSRGHEFFSATRDKFSAFLTFFFSFFLSFKRRAFINYFTTLVIYI